MTKQLPSYSYVQSKVIMMMIKHLSCRMFVVGCLYEITLDAVVCHRRKQTYHIKNPGKFFSQTHTKTEVIRINGSNVHLGISGHRIKTHSNFRNQQHYLEKKK